MVQRPAVEDGGGLATNRSEQHRIRPVVVGGALIVLELHTSVAALIRESAKITALANRWHLIIRVAVDGPAKRAGDDKLPGRKPTHCIAGAVGNAVLWGGGKSRFNDLEPRSPNRVTSPPPESPGCPPYSPETTEDRQEHPLYSTGVQSRHQARSRSLPISLMGCGNWMSSWLDKFASAFIGDVPHGSARWVTAEGGALCRGME